VRRLRGSWPPPILCLLVLGALLLAGCGDGQSEPSPREEVRLEGKPVKPGPGDVVVAALGDSITAGSPLWDPDEEIKASIGSSLDPQSQYEYWVEKRMPGTSFRNCGVFGERTDQIAARLEGCAEGSDVLVVQGGINDIAQMRDVKTAARNLRGMVLRGKELGLRVAITEVLPWNNGPPPAVPRILELNRLIADIGRDEGVPVYPWYERLEDLQAPGRMKPGLTIDGDHPSVEGYKRLADVVRLP